MPLPRWGKTIWLRRRKPTSRHALRAEAGRAGGVEEVAAAPSLHRGTMNALFPIPRSAALMPLHRESCFGVREPQLVRTSKRRERRAPIPTGLHPSAQGCEERATLGNTPRNLPQPQRGCITVSPPARCNPVGVDDVFPCSPRVASRTRQPWAECRYPVGVNQPVTYCHRLEIPPNPRSKSRQLVTVCNQLKFVRYCVRQSVTNCYRLKTGGIFITQPVTICNRLKIPPSSCNLIPPP
jgi:hypothetical protein